MEGKNKKMTKVELIQALQRVVKSDGLACLGCGHEHNCSTRGCAIVRAAVEVKKTQWVNAADRPPEDDVDGETVLAVVCGNPRKNITLHSAIMTAGYFGEDGWMVNEYPEWEKPIVTHWMPLPELPEEVKEQDEVEVIQEMEQHHLRIKLKIGSSVYFVVYDSGLIGEHGEWKVSEEKVVEIGLNGFFISQIKNSSEPNEYIPYTDIGKCCFFNKNEAEKTRKAKEQEKICCNCNHWEKLPFFDGQCNCPQSEFYLQYIPEDRHCECFKEGEGNA